VEDHHNGTKQYLPTMIAPRILQRARKSLIPGCTSFHESSQPVVRYCLRERHTPNFSVELLPELLGYWLDNYF